MIQNTVERITPHAYDPLKRIMPADSHGGTADEMVGETVVESVNESVLNAYRMVREPVGDRPYITSMMVASVDGAIAAEGSSRKLGNPTDTALLLLLRKEADAVIVGAHTAAVENYKPSSVPHLRIIVVSRTPTEDWDRPLWQSPKTTLLTTSNARNIPAHVQVVRAGETHIDLQAGLRTLFLEGVHRVSCEGGPRLNGAFLQEDLFDEVCLTVAPFLVGSDSSRIVAAAHETFHRFSLVHAIAHNDFLYTRYIRNR
jgi:riboflavin biosynthesis pyrimidine reductase